MQIPEKRPTLKTIAQAVGVTPNTVSLALRNSPLVAEKTKKEILSVAKQIGYVHNSVAGSLRSGSSKTVALAFSDFGNPIFSIRLKKMEAVFTERGYQVLILSFKDNPKQEYEAMLTAVSRKVDGVVCSTKYPQSMQVLDRNGVPCVIVGRHFSERLWDCVTGDNVSTAIEATRYLLGKGCKRVHYFTYRLHGISSEDERLTGYRTAMKEHGFDETTIDSLIHCCGDYDNVPAVMENTQIEKDDGVFVYSDHLAWHVACYLPQGTALVSIDGLLSIIKMPFFIPSFGMDYDLEAQYSVDLLLKRIEDPRREVQEMILPMKLIEA